MEDCIKSKCWCWENGPKCKKKVKGSKCDGIDPDDFKRDVWGNIIFK